MSKGYLICKEVYENLQKYTVDPTELDEPSESLEKVTAILCPLTSKYVEVSKIRKVYFC